MFVASRPVRARWRAGVLPCLSAAVRARRSCVGACLGEVPRTRVGPGRDPAGTRPGPGRDPGGTRAGPGRDPAGTRAGPGRDPGPHGSCTGSRRHPKGTLHAAGVARGHFSTLGVAHRRSARNAGGPERGAGPFQRAYLRLQRCPDPGTAARGDAGAGSRPGPAPPVRDRKGGALHASRAVSEPRKGTRTAQSPSLCPRRPAQPPRAPHGHRTAP